MSNDYDPMYRHRFLASRGSANGFAVPKLTPSATSMASGMVSDMATRKITLTVDESVLADLQQGAADAGMQLSPYFARCAHSWMLYQDAVRSAARDRALGMHEAAVAEAELADGQAAEADAEARRGRRA